MKEMPYCKKMDCEVTECRRNPKNITDLSLPHSFAHYEGNPLYCQRNDWNGYQVKKEAEND